MSRRAPISLLAALSLFFGASACSNRLAPYEDLLVGTPAADTPSPKGREVSVTYLGVNGYLLRSASTSILVDPFLSRIPLREVVMDAPVEASEEAISHGLRQGAVPRKVDAVLITHAHFDHLFDTPAIQRRLGGKVITSRTGAYLCEAGGVPGRHLLPSLPGDRYRIGNATVHVLPARHDKVLGRVPYPGLITRPLDEAPSRPSQWRVGVPLAFLIEIEGRRIYLESGGRADSLPPVSDVDLAILGVAVPESQKRYPATVRALRPRYVLASHQDNFFLPLESGFQFSTLADFPRIKAAHEAEQLPGELRLMDYFHTWTLPE